MSEQSRSSALRAPGRRYLAVSMLMASALTLVGWAVYLNLNHGAFLQEQGEARHLREAAIPAHRGKILDRNGQPLAISAPVFSVWADPTVFVEWSGGGDPEKKIDALAEFLELEPAALWEKILSRSDREFLYLRRQLTPAHAERVRALAVPGVGLRREDRRYYPLGEAASHVIGFAGMDEEGQEGVELALEARLAGHPGSERVLRDNRGRVVERVERLEAPRPGEDIVLSIDAQIQHIAYQALLDGVKEHRAHAGSAVVLDVRSGEVLAMVNQPSYNPNRRTRPAGGRLRNRAITDVFEPGSTIKPFIVAAALESGQFNVGTVVDTTPGTFRVGRHTVRDVRNYGVIDVAQVVVVSSNIGATKLALAIDPELTWRRLSRVGFGTGSASGFPGEAQGVLNHFSGWRQTEHVTLSYGYGVSATALQLARAYAVIANGGLLPRVSFVRVGRPDDWPRVMSEPVARQMRHVLEAVVAPGGTGRRAGVPGYRIGGKTGTSRKIIGGRYADDRYISLFAGIAPMSHPRLAIVVMVDDPSGEHYYGGRVAAPVFSRIAQGALRVLAVAPDDHVVVTRRVHLRSEGPDSPLKVSAASGALP